MTVNLEAAQVQKNIGNSSKKENIKDGLILSHDQQSTGIQTKIF